MEEKKEKALLVGLNITSTARKIDDIDINESMEELKELAKAAGAEVDVLTASEFGADKMDAYDAVAFGCPAMGAEELEDSEFEPMFSDCEGKLGGKKIALFGSYGWGDGEWMRTWEETCKADGAVLACESVLANEAPDDEAVAACQALGKALC